MAMRKRLAGLRREAILEINAEEMDKPLTNEDFKVLGVSLATFVDSILMYFRMH